MKQRTGKTKHTTLKIKKLNPKDCDHNQLAYLNQAHSKLLCELCGTRWKNHDDYMRALGIFQYQTPPPKPKIEVPPYPGRLTLYVEVKKFKKT